MPLVFLDLRSVSSKVVWFRVLGFSLSLEFQCVGFREVWAFFRTLVDLEFGVGGALWLWGKCRCCSLPSLSTTTPKSSTSPAASPVFKKDQS